MVNFILSTYCGTRVIGDGSPVSPQLGMDMVCKYEQANGRSIFSRANCEFWCRVASALVGQKVDFREVYGSNSSVFGKTSKLGSESGIFESNASSVSGINDGSRNNARLSQLRE